MATHIGTGYSIASSTVTELASFAATALNFENREVNRIPVPALSTPKGPIPNLFGDLYEEGGVTAPGYFDTLRDFEPGTDLGTLTITARQNTGETAPATMVGAAIIMSESKAAPVEDVVTQELNFGWLNGYTFTAATTS